MMPETPVTLDGTPFEHAELLLVYTIKTDAGTKTVVLTAVDDSDDHVLYEFPGVVEDQDDGMLLFLHDCGDSAEWSPSGGYWEIAGSNYRELRVSRAGNLSYRDAAGRLYRPRKLEVDQYELIYGADHVPLCLRRAGSPPLDENQVAYLTKEVVLRNRKGDGRSNYGMNWDEPHLVDAHFRAVEALLRLHGAARA
jgi:hypothetical protein